MLFSFLFLETHHYSDHLPGLGLVISLAVCPFIPQVEMNPPLHPPVSGCVKTWELAFWVTAEVHLGLYPVSSNGQYQKHHGNEQVLLANSFLP